MKTLNVLLPVHNAQGRLAASVSEILEVLAQSSGRFELCILDDGSSDETAEEARELATRFPQVRLIRHPVRLGLNEAIQTGLDHTNGELVLVGSDDYALDPDDLRTLWRLRDAQGQSSSDARADSRPEKLLAWRPGSPDGRRGFDIVPREAFEQFHLRQALEMTCRIDVPRTSPATIIARRLREPKFLRMAGNLAVDE